MVYATRATSLGAPFPLTPPPNHTRTRASQCSHFAPTPSCPGRRGSGSVPVGAVLTPGPGLLLLALDGVEDLHQLHALLVHLLQVLAPLHFNVQQQLHLKKTACQ